MGIRRTYGTDKYTLRRTRFKLSGQKEKGRGALIIFLLVLILAAGGGAAYYVYQRQLPADTVESFLGSMQKMDFKGMEALLQSSDLSVLDNADILNEAYTDFFKKINAKMTYRLTKTNFDIQNGTAQVTAHIRYIDGTDIYKETISEFLRHIVSTALSGENVTATQAQTPEKLAGILTEKADTTEDTFAETDITYPLVKINDQWKIVALDDETVKIMSANFKNVQDEITRSLSDVEENIEEDIEEDIEKRVEESIEEDAAEDTTENIEENIKENTDEPDFPETPSAVTGDTIDMTVDQFSVRYVRHKVSKDFGQKPCLLVYYDYTNNSDSPSSAMVDVNLQAYQNGQLCGAAIPEENDSALDRFMAEVKPGKTAMVCQAFSLKDTSEVTLKASESFHFGTGESASQILEIK